MDDETLIVIIAFSIIGFILILICIIGCIGANINDRIDYNRQKREAQMRSDEIRTKAGLELIEIV
jgi:hypothetical protein